VKKKLKIKQGLRKLLKRSRAMVGIEAAIVLIAFVIVAAAFSFMVVNMGLFATQRGKTTINQGVTSASSPLIVDGDIMIHGTTAPFYVDAMMIPLQTIGVNYVPMGQNATEVSLSVGSHTSIADCYLGVAPVFSNGTGSPLATTLDGLVTQLNATATGGTTATGTWARLFIGNSNNNTSLDFFEKGYLVFTFATADRGAPGEQIYIQIRPQNSAPISIDFVAPVQLTSGWQQIGS
jgi:flagellin FlaB